MNNEDALVFWSKCESNSFIKIFSALKARIVESPSRDAERCDKIGERARKKFNQNFIQIRKLHHIFPTHLSLLFF